MYSARFANIALALVIPAFLSGQVPVVDPGDLFYESDQVTWSRVYHGMANEAHPVALHLAFDGETYRGYLVADTLQMELEGNRSGDRVELKEIDRNGRLSGQLSGSLDDNRLSVKWWSVDHSRSVDIDALRDGLIELKSFEPTFLTMSGDINGAQVSGNLMIESEEVVSGIWWLDGTCIQVIGTCQDNLCNSLKLLPRGAQELIEVRRSKMGIALTSPQGTGNARVGYRAPLVTKQSTDYRSLVEMTYPAFENTAFVQWIQQGFSEWGGQVNTDMANLPEYRWRNITSSWIDVYSYTDNLVTGLITRYNLLDDQYERENFMFDLEESRSLNIEDITRDARALIDAMQAAVGGNDSEHHYWVPTAEGMAMITDFDHIEGEAVTLVPYAFLKKYLRKRSPIGALLD